MVSHDAHVLAGNIGSSSRTKKINNMLDEIDKKVKKAREYEKREIEEVLVRSGTLATELNFSQSTICRNGFPQFFTKYFDSIHYKENKGIIIEIEEYVEERKEQRKQIAKLKE